MKIDKIEEYIKNTSSLGKKEFSELGKLIEEYPYFQTAHLLYIASAKNVNSKNFEQILSKSSAFVSNREVLYDLINSTNTAGIQAVTKNNDIVDKGNAKVKTIIKTDNKAVNTETKIVKPEEKSVKVEKDNIKVIKETVKDKTTEAENKTTKTIKETAPKVNLKVEKTSITKKGENIHSALINEIIKPIIESEKSTITTKKEDKKKVIIKEIAEIKKTGQKIDKQPKITKTEQKIDKQPEIKKITKDAPIKKEVEEKKIVVTQNKIQESKVNKIEVEKEEKPKVEEIVIEVNTQNKYDSKDSKSITDEIYNKIANLKSGNKKTKPLSTKGNTIKKADIFTTKKEKAPVVKKTEDKNIKPEIIIKSDKKDEPNKDVKTKVNIIKKNIVEQPEKENLKAKIKTPIVIKEDKKVEVKQDVIKKDEDKKTEVKEVVVKEEEDKKAEDKKAEVKEAEVKKVVVKKEENKKTVKKEEDEKGAAAGILDRIARYKKKTDDDKVENDNLINKFIEKAPRLDRKKEISIKGDVSKESIKEKKPVITELMANILINQGHYNKAIEIFNQLILKNPEKKDYFVTKITETEKMKEDVS